MFAEARDNGARKWVKEGFAKKRDSPFSDPVFGKYGLSHKMPSTAKFQSGHLPSGIIPVSKAVPVASGSGSDMDTSSDSDDDEVYGARYSLDSSPQDDRVPIGVGPMHTNYINRNANYATVSVQKQGHGIGDGDSSDSVTSSRVYYQSVRLQPNENTKGKQFQDSHGRRLQNKVLFDGIPSAPPCAYSAAEINQAADQIPTFVAYGAPCPDSSYCSSTTDEPNPNRSIPAATTVHDTTTNRIHDRSLSAGGGAEAATCSGSLPAQCPTYHASGLGPWCAMISYDACIRLCLYSWARGCEEAPMFLENECMLLRSTFGLQQVVLQPEEELLSNPAKELNSEGAAVRPKKTFGKMKVQVRKVKLASDLPIGCSFSSLKPPMAKKLESLRFHMSNAKSTLSSGWGALRQVRVAPQIPANSSFSRQSLAYVHAGTRYVQEVSGILKSGVINFRSTASSYEEVQETYSCLLRLKSSAEEDAVRMQAGSGETHVFLPDGLGDDLILEVHDSKGKYCGRVVAQVAAIADDPGDKLRWWSIYQEPEHELVGRIQLYINYTTSLDESNHPKCGSVAETVAYDLVLEVAMKVQDFKPRNLLLHGSWKWLVTEFASYYGVSDSYTKLRYLSYIMDVATPTADCLSLVHDLLAPVIMKGRVKGALSHQENRILGEVHDRIEDILALVFENYKSLDESSESGIVDVFKPATGLAAPALEPALKLYNLMHDILSSEAQLKLCRYFQVAAKKRSRMHLLETDEFVSSNTGSMDSVALSTAYQKMKSLCFSMKNEIYTDIQIHNLDVLPSFIELPSLLSSIYSVELCKRLREFLIACPPNGPSPPVTDLVIAAADFQKDLALWNISPTKGGVDAKELFHYYIIRWIQDKRLALLESCKLDKVKWSNNQTQHSTTPFVDDMYDQLKETLSEYEVIICRWPEYTFVLEKAIADVEKAIVDTLDKQYAEVLSPLKENLSPIKFGIKYVQKIATGTVCPYSVPEELGILLNSFKWMLDVLRPKIEAQLKSWGSCTIDGGNAAPGEYLSEVTVMLRTKFRNYLQAVVEKLAENTRMQNETKLKKIIQESKDTVLESDIRNRMQPLKDLLMKTIDHLHTVFETQIFIIICRGFWDRMGQDMLRFLENRNENKSCYKGSRVAVSILDDTFASQMQQLIGNALQEKDLEPPRSIMAVRSMLCKDTVNHNDNNYYY